MDLPLVNVGSSEQFGLPADNALEQRLGLYQVFLKLYEQNRPLLDEILNLEGAKGRLSAKATEGFIQGIVQGHQVLLITNLLDGKTQAIQQTEQIWTVGRGHGMALPVPDKRLSRCHAAIQYVKSEGFYLVDLGSTNGSFVNGERVHRRVLLQDGDRIRLSSLTFYFFVCQQFHQGAAALPEVRAHLQGLSMEQPPSAPVEAKTVVDVKTSIEETEEPEPTSFFLR